MNKRLSHGSGVPGRVTMQAFSVGNSTIRDIWLEVEGARVNNGGSVAPGKSFQVHVSFEANNAESGLVNAWCTCITVTDTSGAIRNYKQKNSALSAGGQIASSDLTLDKMGSNIMPNVSQLDLRVKVWGSDSLNPSPEYPDYSLW